MIASSHIKENQLQFVWKHQLLMRPLYSLAGEEIHVLKPGIHNALEGPDFLQAKIKVGDKVWHGQVEIHCLSSDWDKHRHSQDPNYTNTILHVVYEHDKEVDFLKERRIPTLELKDKINPVFLIRYNEMMQQETKLACQPMLERLRDGLKKDALELAYIERLEKRYEKIVDDLDEFQGNWEKLTAVLLAETFGSKYNKKAFGAVMRAIPFKLIRKYGQNSFQLEALFLGMSGLLERQMDFSDTRSEKYHAEFQYLKQVHDLKPPKDVKFKKMRLRPANYPTVRWVQLAAMYKKHQNVCKVILEAKSPKDIQDLFGKLDVSEYWQTHYELGLKSKKKYSRQLSTSMLNLLMINLVLPLRFAYDKQMKTEAVDYIFDFARALAPEVNHIVRKYRDAGFDLSDALETQAILTLKDSYCDQKKCLNCRIGQEILGDDKAYS